MESALARTALVRLVAILAVVSSTSSCARPVHEGFSARRKTCLVLSVGGASGLAHAGAIDELRRRGVRIDCIVGNSMGALVGGLYAANPESSAVSSLESLLASYIARSEDDAAGSGILGAIFFGVLTGGLGGAFVGGLLGAGSVDQLDIDRAASVIDAQVGGIYVEETEIPFATFYMERRGEGIETVEATDIPLSEAIAHSIANPYIWDDVSSSNRRRLDPGADRVSAVPVEDACTRFPDAQLIVLNVTSHPAFVTSAMACPWWEITIPTIEIDSERGLADSDSRELLYETGRAAIERALDR